MYDEKQHSIPNRIVSLVDGYAQIETFSWDAFNEGTTLIESATRYLMNYVHFPTRILADKIFRTRENLAFCKQHGIHLYTLNLIKMRLADTGEVSIRVAFLTMKLFRKVKILFARFLGCVFYLDIGF